MENGQIGPYWNKKFLAASMQLQGCNANANGVVNGAKIRREGTTQWPPKALPTTCHVLLVDVLRGYLVVVPVMCVFVFR